MELSFPIFHRVSSRRVFVWVTGTRVETGAVNGWRETGDGAGTNQVTTSVTLTALVMSWNKFKGSFELNGRQSRWNTAQKSTMIVSTTRRWMKLHLRYLLVLLVND